MNANGKDPAAPGNPVPTPDQVAQANVLIAQVQPAIHTSVHVLLRGLIASCPGVRADVVMSLFAFEAGQAVGTALAGDLVSILQVRKACMNSFEEGVRKSPTPGNVQAAWPSGAGAPPNLRG